MMKAKILVAVFVLGLFIPCVQFLGQQGAGATANEDAAKSIVEKADGIRFPQAGYQVTVKITTSAPGRDPGIREYEILSKGNERTIIRTLSPAADKGQALLMRDRDLWFYSPSLSQPIRLSVAQKLTGQVANGDLARANFGGDYAARIVKTETMEGETYNVLELKAVDRSVTYDRVIYWVEKKTDHPFKAEFYALSGRLLKTCRYENYKEAAGGIRPTRLIMEDALLDGTKSVLEYSDLRVKDFPDKIFAKDYMKRF